MDRYVSHEESGSRDCGQHISGNGESTRGLLVRAVTSGPMHHFFGYFGIQPWDVTGQYLLCLEVPFHDRAPRAEDIATVGMVDLATLEFIRLAETRAWNFQQGAMLQWVPTAPDSEIIFNDRGKDHFMSVILNVWTGQRRTLPRAISAMSHDGKTALSLNFSRLNWARPGYGYAGIEDPFVNENRPLRDSVYLIDLENGEDRQVISLGDILSLDRRITKTGGRALFFNHALYNKDDSRFAFLIQWQDYLLPRWARVWKLKKLGYVDAVMFTANLDGTDPYSFVEFGEVSHFDWRGSREILMWAKREDSEQFYLVTDRTEESRRVGRGVLTRDGHCSFSPNGCWILTDTYPDKNRYGTLKIFNLEHDYEVVLGRYHASLSYVGEIRCDLHPRWNRTGTQICFDSIHEGSRQLYVMDVASVTEE